MSDLRTELAALRDEWMSEPAKSSLLNFQAAEGTV